MKEKYRKLINMLDLIRLCWCFFPEILKGPKYLEDLEGPTRPKGLEDWKGYLEAGRPVRLRRSGSSLKSMRS